MPKRKMVDNIVDMEKTPTETEVTHTIEQIQKGLVELDQHIDLLRDRLSPVLSSSVVGEAPETKNELECEVGRKLEAIADRIDFSKEMLTDITRSVRV